MLIVLLNKVLTLHVFAAFFTKVTSLAAVRTKVQSVCCSMTLIISPILVFVTFLSTQAKGFQRILLKLHNAASMFFPQKRVHDISSPSHRQCLLDTLALAGIISKVRFTCVSYFGAISITRLPGRFLLNFKSKFLYNSAIENNSSEYIVR